MILWYALAHMRTKGLLLIYLATQDVTNSHSPCVHRVQQVLYCAAPLVKQNGLLANAKSSLSYEVKAQYSETPWPCKAHVPASRYTQGTPRTHPGHAQDTPRTHPEHTQDTPRTHPGHTQDTPRTHPLTSWARALDFVYKSTATKKPSASHFIPLQGKAM